MGTNRHIAYAGGTSDSGPEDVLGAMVSSTRAIMGKGSINTLQAIASSPRTVSELYTNGKPARSFRIEVTEIDDIEADIIEINGVN